RGRVEEREQALCGHLSRRPFEDSDRLDDRLATAVDPREGHDARSLRQFRAELGERRLILAREGDRDLLGARWRDAGEEIAHDPRVGDVDREPVEARAFPKHVRGEAEELEIPVGAGDAAELDTNLRDLPVLLRARRPPPDDRSLVRETERRLAIA